MIKGYIECGLRLWRFIDFLIVFQKLTGIVHNQFSTGHANSPCTIIIGKAHIEKVSGPARPHRMLNNFVVNKPMDFSEDPSGKSIAMALRNQNAFILLCGSTWVGITFVYLLCVGQEDKPSSQLGGSWYSRNRVLDWRTRPGPWRFGVTWPVGSRYGRKCTSLPGRAARVYDVGSGFMVKKQPCSYNCQSRSNWFEWCFASRFLFLPCSLAGSWNKGFSEPFIVEPVLLFSVKVWCELLTLVLD